MERTGCAIAGGGPAGLMLGLLLARAGIAVTVLEKHADFLRDFRGDTVHASTVRLLDQLGLGTAFAALSQSRLGNFALPGADGDTTTLANFDALPPPYNFIAMVPQWDLLNLLAAAAQREPGFRLERRAEVTGLCHGPAGEVCGLAYRDAAGVERELAADLVVACDGRGSVLRAAAGLVPHEFPVPFDTWWFRLPRHPDERSAIASLVPRFKNGDFVLSLTRESYFQIAYLARKGADARLRAEGVARFRERIAAVRPDFADRVEAIGSMDEVRLLDVRLNRLATWHRPGLLLIGDAAHAMSPAGGVGINLAIQDAVAAATQLAAPLRQGAVDEKVLAAIQRRRMMPTRALQLLQRLLHRLIFAPALQGRQPAIMGVLSGFTRLVPALAVLPARMIAFGPRPESAPVFARRPDMGPVAHWPDQ